MSDSVLFFIIKVIVFSTRFYFSFDATYADRSAKYINDSAPAYQNCLLRKLEVDKKPVLCLFASKDIQAGTELR